MAGAGALRTHRGAAESVAMDEPTDGVQVTGGLTEGRTLENIYLKGGQNRQLGRNSQRREASRVGCRLCNQL